MLTLHHQTTCNVAQIKFCPFLLIVTDDTKVWQYRHYCWVTCLWSRQVSQWPHTLRCFCLLKSETVQHQGKREALRLENNLNFQFQIFRIFFRLKKYCLIYRILFIIKNIFYKLEIYFLLSDYAVRFMYRNS